MRVVLAIGAYAIGISIALVVAVASGTRGSLIFALVCFLALLVALAPSRDDQDE